MNTSQIVTKMIAFSEGNLHDINHFLKVYGFARTIGVCEGLDERAQAILETAAILHDIACPLCREKYGNTNGKYQELEGAPMTCDFLQEMNFDNEFIEQVAYLVGNHHSFDHINNIEHQILIEADYIVNADEGHYSRENIYNMAGKVFKTKTGISLLTSIYQQK